MKRLIPAGTLAALLVLLLAPGAHAAFGVKDFSLGFVDANGTPATQAGSHPFAVTNVLELNTTVDPGFVGEVPDEALKNIEVALPEGIAGIPAATPRCSAPDFIDISFATKLPHCSNSTAVGTFTLKARVLFEPEYFSSPVYNLIPPPGVIQKLGFSAYGVPIAIDFTLSSEAPYHVVASVENTSQVLGILGSELTVWGNPANPIHDSERGSCVLATWVSTDRAIKTTGASCPANTAEKPFLTLPPSCRGPLPTHYKTDSWEHPGPPFVEDTVFTQELTGCAKLGFRPTISAEPTTRAAQSPTGLDFSLDVKDEGLLNPTGLAQSDIKKAVVTLPEGFSTNPSVAEGLNVCSQADLARETVNSALGAGCPNASKVGTVEVQSPLVDESINGALFIATPYENQVGSLLALYMVIKNPTLGIVIKQALKVENDPVTGRITTVAEEIPELPFSHFRLHFREGTRSPLASPPGCGSYSASAVLTPWAGGPSVTTTSAFQIVTGSNAGPCPSGGTPPFRPGLEAGTINNAAGRYSPFYLRLSRNDGEQEFTHFSIKLPPGLVGKLAGIPFCSDAAIAAARARTGPHGGQEEIEHPSCPAVSEIGHTLAGAGVGPSLAYAPGKVYLAGPYRGSALSIAAVTAAKVGPFDLGTVVIRSALRINPETAEVFIDATGSDPIPHIIKGIPVHARDIRVYVDKSNFVLNPTSCAKTSTASTVLGSGLDFGSEADDAPITVTSPFQAADCASLGFAPKLALSVNGGSKRGGHPKFKAVLTYPKGSYANIAAAQVTLPHSEFLDQSHIKTICTRVQFNAGTVPGEKCPAASIYGFAKAITPLLDEPIQGPVFLRSSSHNLPDVVAALHSGKIDVNLVGRIDSVKGGRIRNTFESVPDAPVTSFTLALQGGKKGLLVNSTNLCKSTNKAIADFTGQNGKKSVFNPALEPQCGKARNGKKQKRR